MSNPTIETGKDEFFHFLQRLTKQFQHGEPTTFVDPDIFYETRRAKAETLRDALYLLIEVLEGEPEFRADKSLNRFVDYLHQLTPHKIFQLINKRGRNPVHATTASMFKDQIRIIESMLQPEYTPPNQKTLLCWHMMTLLTYYEEPLDTRAVSLELRLDVARGKLIDAASFTRGASLAHIVRDVERTKNINIQKGEQAELHKQRVFQIDDKINQNRQFSRRKRAQRIEIALRGKLKSRQIQYYLKEKDEKLNSENH